MSNKTMYFKRMLNRSNKFIQLLDIELKVYELIRNYIKLETKHMQN